MAVPKQKTSKTKAKKPIYKRVWFIILAAFVAVIAFVTLVNSCSGNSSSSTKPTSSSTTDQKSDFDTNSLIGKNVVDADNAIKAAGLKTTMVFPNDPNTDVTKDVMDDATSAQPSDTWIVQKAEQDEQTVKLTVESQKLINLKNNSENQKKNLEAKLSTSSALAACRSYGEKQYPYGFKTHDIVGIIQDFTPKDDNTWFYKATVDVTNAAGATEKNKTYECSVTGTSANPQVSQFNVY